MHALEVLGRDANARETAELFRLLIDSVIDYAIYMLTPEGRVATWNSGAARIKQYTDTEIIGSHFSRFYTPKDIEAGLPMRALATARDAGRFEGQGWRVRKDGSQFWASVIVDPVRDERGQLIGYAKVTRDITEQRNAAEALEKTREALFQAQKMETIGQLSGGIAHDFNNMLAGILGSLHMLRTRLAEGNGEEANRYLDVAIESGKRAASLTSRLLAYGRRQTLDIKSIDVNETVASMEDLLYRTLGENVRLVLDLSAANGAARTDVNQLESALLNLAINARDAMPDGGDLIIATEQVEFTTETAPSGLAPGKYVRLSVQDNGSGMPADVAEKAFDPFFTTKPIGIGTGLGLSMVYGFLNQAGGGVRLSTRENEGTTIDLFLPAADCADAIDATPAPVVERMKGGKTVLVVEDEALVRLLIVDVLGDLGYQVLEARDANEAMSEISSGRPIDLLLTDVGLPGLNGRQLAASLRKSRAEHRPELRVLFLTGYAEPRATRRSEFLGPRHGHDGQAVRGR